MKANVTVAPIGADDLEEALPLFAGYQRFYEAEPDDARNLAFFRRFVAPSEDGILFGAWLDGRLVGFACTYWTFSSTHAAEAGLMNDLFVAEGTRGAGIGRALIEAAAAAARDKGMRHLEWFTAVDNLRAQRLYDSMEAEKSAWYAYEILLE
ncbi:MAG: GNAT family N-acetyltransferase [Actinobacteria bacterium]|nr:MAG: GNAT family N-acetyltransferase [Actinomycetota bacterium]